MRPGVRSVPRMRERLPAHVHRVFLIRQALAVEAMPCRMMPSPPSVEIPNTFKLVGFTGPWESLHDSFPIR